MKSELLFLLICWQTPSKENAGRVELDRSGVDGGDGGPLDGGAIGADVPWEKRYEKLWVEVEKKEVKSSFRSVAGELKEKFGEFNSRRPPENTAEERSASSSAEEESSDEDEVITRPAARARSSTLFTIPEQREDSAAELPESPSDEENLEQGGDGHRHGGLDLHSAAAPRSCPRRETATERESEDHLIDDGDDDDESRNNLQELVLKGSSAGSCSPDSTNHRPGELQETRLSELKETRLSEPDPAASEELKESVGSVKPEAGRGLPPSAGKETKVETEVEGCSSSLSGLNLSFFITFIYFLSFLCFISCM